MTIHCQRDDLRAVGSSNMRDRIFHALDARRLHFAPSCAVQLQRLAKRQQRDIRRVGSQKKCFSETGLAMSQ